MKSSTLGPPSRWVLKSGCRAMPSASFSQILAHSLQHSIRGSRLKFTCPVSRYLVQVTTRLLLELVPGPLNWRTLGETMWTAVRFAVFGIGGLLALLAGIALLLGSVFVVPISYMAVLADAVWRREVEAIGLCLRLPQYSSDVLSRSLAGLSFGAFQNRHRRTGIRHCRSPYRPCTCSHSREIEPALQD